MDANFYHLLKDSFPGEKYGLQRKKKIVTTHIYIVNNVHMIFNKNELEVNNTSQLNAGLSRL
jgi:hypothetical protein